MSWEQGPRVAGMRPAAIAVGRRQLRWFNRDNGTEATE